MTYCDFVGPTPTNFIDTTCVKCGKPLGEHVVPGSHNVVRGIEAMLAKHDPNVAIGQSALVPNDADQEPAE